MFFCRNQSIGGRSGSGSTRIGYHPSLKTSRARPKNIEVLLGSSMPHTSDQCTRAWWNGGALAIAATVLASSPGAVRADTCTDVQAVADGPTRPNTHEGRLAEARSYAIAGQFPTARGLYQSLIHEDHADQSALLGLALVDAWSGCRENAEREFRQMLEHNARDVEARAGLIDVLMWNAHWDEARGVLEQGLTLDPDSPALLTRQAKVLFWSGDAARAIETADRVERMVPADDDIRALRDKMFLGEVRTYARIDAFPSGYPNLYSAGVQGLQRIRTAELSVGTHVQRYVGAGRSSEADGRHTVGVAVHFGVGVTAGLGVGFGAPAHVVPTSEAKFFVTAPLVSIFTGQFSYSLWEYRDSKAVHIFAPELGLAVHDDVTVLLRWWAAYATLHPPPSASASPQDGLVHTFSLRGVWRPRSRLAIGAAYTYGIQLDENPPTFSLFALRSHIGNVFANWGVNRTFGITANASLERRAGPSSVVLITSFECGAYVRW